MGGPRKLSRRGRLFTRPMSPSCLDSTGEPVGVDSAFREQTVSSSLHCIRPKLKLLNPKQASQGSVAAMSKKRRCGWIFAIRLVHIHWHSPWTALQVSRHAEAACRCKLRELVASAGLRSPRFRRLWLPDTLLADPA